jgi:hypothetical protein
MPPKRKHASEVEPTNGSSSNSSQPEVAAPRPPVDTSPLALEIEESPSKKAKVEPVVTALDTEDEGGDTEVDEEEEEDDRPPCWYGANCYRKVPPLGFIYLGKTIEDVPVRSRPLPLSSFP